MIVLRESDYRPTPWKNGGGTTREIHREPPAPIAFDWRLSLATIDSPGPFSAFNDYARTLVLVRGAGVELAFGDHGRSRLTATGDMVSFDGAWQTDCTLIDGSSTDLNLIVSKERLCATSRCVQLTAAQSIQTAGSLETLVCCLCGSVQLTNAAGAVSELSAVDVARCFPTDGEMTCQLRGQATARLFIAAVSRRI